MQPLLVMVPLGYSISLLVCEGHHCGLQANTQSIVQRVIESVFQETSSPENSAPSLQTISFVQIYTDGTALDLLSSRNQTLQVTDIPPLGLVVEEATEIIVTESQAATHLYLQGVSVYQNCLQQMGQKQDKTVCGLLFTIIREVKVMEGREFQRSTIRIFEFSGGDEQCYTHPFSALSRASSALGLPAEARCVSWILKHLLEGNALTFLLLCLTLPDASGEDILSALSLTEQVRAITKTVTQIHWDPSLEAQKRRTVIGELRAQLLLSNQMEQDGMLIQLGKAIKELQVLKSQNWEKKKATSTYELKEDTSLEVRDPVSSELDDGDEHENRLGSQLSVNDTHDEEEISGGNNPNTHFGEEATQNKSFLFATPISRDLIPNRETQAHNLAGEQHQDAKLRFSQAKAQRQHLQEQDRLLIQQEYLTIEKECAAQNKISPDQKEALLQQKERSLLVLQVEMLQKEQAEAERDLADLYQDYQRETDARKDHMLQVFRAYRKHAEEKMEALEQRYRKLLRESLQDAILLSTQNQQLRVQKQLGCTERAMQTDPSP